MNLLPYENTHSGGNHCESIIANVCNASVACSQHWLANVQGIYLFWFYSIGHAKELARGRTTMVFCQTNNRNSTSITMRTFLSAVPTNSEFYSYYITLWLGKFENLQLLMGFHGRFQGWWWFYSIESFCQMWFFCDFRPHPRSNIYFSLFEHEMTTQKSDLPA